MLMWDFGDVAVWGLPMLLQVRPITPLVHQDGVGGIVLLVHSYPV